MHPTKRSDSDTGFRLTAVIMTPGVPVRESASHHVDNTLVRSTVVNREIEGFGVYFERFYNGD
jgi:hypothetical protein